MKNISLHLCLALSVMAFSACNDSFMERTPKTEISADQFFKSEQDLKMYCYGLVNTPGYNYVGDAGTDMQATTDNVEIKNIMTMDRPTATVINGGWDWKRLYDINFLLDHLAQADVDEATRAHYEGVARFYRAEFYMDKVKRFSDVPWYDHVLTSRSAELYAKRSPRDSVVMHIFDDYQYAANHVSEVTEKGTVNRWIVLAKMARHALYEGTYRKYHAELNLQSTANKYLSMAAQACEIIMKEGGFRLYSTGNPGVDYATLFNSVDLSNNPEMIQAAYYEKGVADNGLWGAYMFGNYIPSPSKKLVQTYLMKDGSYYSSQPGWQTKQFVEEFVNRDPRMYQTLAYPGWEMKGPMSYAPGLGIYVQTLNKNLTGYHQLKGFPNSKDQDYYYSIDYPSIRYAEVLLTYAEAKAEMGEVTQQLLDQTVNLVRARAGMPPLMMNVTADPVMAAQFPRVSPVLLEIRRERAVEFAFEGLRYDDLMRWHAGKLLEQVPEGLYFPSLGKFDLTGDGVPDICLIPSSASIPADNSKETNALGTPLIYYRAGTVDDGNATVYLKDGTHGNIVTAKTMGTFTEPRDYYRPVPRTEVELNPNLLPQLFGWETE